MKRILTLLLVTILIFTLTACGEDSVSTSSETETSSSSDVLEESSEPVTEQSSSSSVPPHTHKFLEATCVAPKTCECGETEGEPLGHMFSEGTCATPAICLVCNEEDTIKKEHNFSNATCTEAGKCIVCDEKNGEPLGHNWNSATCTAPKSCTRCNVAEGQALGHNYKETRVEGNCLQKGYIDRLCTRCQDSSIEYLDVSSHKYTEHYEQDSEQYHKKVYTCIVCSHSYSDYLAHSFGGWVTIKEATPTEQGERSCECSVCGYVKTEYTNETQSNENTTPTTPSVSQGDYLNRVLELVNIERQKVGAPPLQYYSAGQSLADIRANEIVTKFSHTRPDGTQWYTVLEGLDYTMSGENIAYGYTTPESVMVGWMNSEGHKANILEPRFTHIIVGYTSTRNSWVQLFLKLE